MSASSRLDRVYRNILQTKFFTKGWGNTDNLKRLFEFRKVVSRRESCNRLVPSDYPVSVFKDEISGEFRILEGKFLSPFVNHLPNILPKEAETAYFQAILPAKWQSNHYKPVCIHLAGTGDHGYWRRRQIMAKPLVKEAGIGAVLLENPFYGLRKPKDQVRSSLHNVSDIFVMGGCLILESLAVLHWCENSGFGPLGLTGISMGGHMASLAATNWPKPVVLVPCLSWSTASSVFTEGVMSDAINWELLESQYFSDEAYREDIRKMVTVKENEDFLSAKSQYGILNGEKSSNMKAVSAGTLKDAFRAGQLFAKHYPQSLDRINELKEESQGNDKLNAKHGLSSKECNMDKMGSINMSETCENNETFSLENRNEISGSDHKKSSLHGMLVSSVNKQEIVDKLDSFHNQNNFNECCETINRYNNVEGAKLFNHSNSISNGKSNMAPMDIGHQSVPTSKLKELLNELNVVESWRKRNEDKTKGTPQQLKRKRDYEVLQFMRGIMDECTHLQNFDVPVDTSLIISVCARNDAYVPRDSCTHLSDIWPGAEIRYVDGGHVSAYVLYQSIFRAAIVECFNRLKKKYYS